MTLEERVRRAIGDYVPPAPAAPVLAAEKNPMGYGRPRKWLADDESKARVWELHQQGLSAPKIGALVGVPDGSVLDYLRNYHGVRKRSRGLGAGRRVKLQPIEIVDDG